MLAIASHLASCSRFVILLSAAPRSRCTFILFSGFGWRASCTVCCVASIEEL
jgi:hypothetical protein